MKFHRLKIVREAGKAAGHRMVVCDCKCGKRVIKRFYHLKSGGVKSCGCLQTEKRFRHGGFGTRLYSIWSGMLQRCHNPRNPGYARYGGRGVFVCKAWRKFAAFREWSLTHGYRSNLTLDRRKGGRGYSPGNCRWATAAQQTQNRGNIGRRKFIGVYKVGRRWRATIAAERRRYNLGYFDTATLAAAARDKAAKKLHGAFASLNLRKK